MTRVLLLVSALCLSGCLRSEELRTQTASLDFWMSPDQVRAVMGEPKTVLAAICGEKVGPGWKCTRWRYRKLTDEVFIYFQPSGEPCGLAVNHWSLSDEGDPGELHLLQREGR